MSCPLFHDAARYSPHDIFPIVFERTGKTLLVDNSKRLKWMELHARDSTFQQKYIHVVRDPRGVIYSRQTRGRTTRLSHWPKQQHRFHEALSRPGRDARIVLYNELATDRERILRKLLSWLELDFEASQLAYWKVEHHGAGRNGATAGFLTSAGTADESFYATRVRDQFHDLRWRDHLDPALREAIEQHEPTGRALAELGLGFTESALERVR
jgi:hypothetical protein